MRKCLNLVIYDKLFMIFKSLTSVKSSTEKVTNFFWKKFEKNFQKFFFGKFQIFPKTNSRYHFCRAFHADYFDILIDGFWVTYDSEIASETYFCNLIP